MVFHVCVNVYVQIYCECMYAYPIPQFFMRSFLISMPCCFNLSLFSTSVNWNYQGLRDIILFAVLYMYISIYKRIVVHLLHSNTYLYTRSDEFLVKPVIGLNTNFIPKSMTFSFSFFHFIWYIYAQIVDPLPILILFSQYICIYIHCFSNLLTTSIQPRKIH